MTDRLGRLLLVTLEAARVDADLPVLGALRAWLNSWRRIGAVERGMAHQGYDRQLTRYDEKGWRVTFYTTGMEHSITSRCTVIRVLLTALILASCASVPLADSAQDAASKTFTAVTMALADGTYYVFALERRLTDHA